MTETAACRTYLDRWYAAKRQGKPLLMAKAVAEAVTVLPTSAEVAYFVRRVRTALGIQDLELIPAAKFMVDVEKDGSWKPSLSNVSTDDLRAVVAEAASFRIDFANTAHHYGTAVFYSMPNGTHFRAFSTDYALSETYFSS
jgi:hypothetical protein